MQGIAVLIYYMLIRLTVRLKESWIMMQRAVTHISLDDWKVQKPQFNVYPHGQIHVETIIPEEACMY